MEEIDLRHPIVDLDGQTITRVKLERPQVKHLRALDNATGDIDRTSALIAALTGLSTRVVDLMDAEDFGVLGEKISGFFGGSPPTGKM